MQGLGHEIDFNVREAPCGPEGYTFRCGAPRGAGAPAFRMAGQLRHPRLDASPRSVLSPHPRTRRVLNEEPDAEVGALASLCLAVADLGASLAFYCDALGLLEVDRGDEFVVLAAGGPGVEAGGGGQAGIGAGSVVFRRLPRCLPGRPAPRPLPVLRPIALLPRPLQALARPRCGWRSCRRGPA